MILNIILFLGCKQANEQAEAVSESVPSLAQDLNELDVSFSNADLARQKLQDYLDLIALQNAHPSFKDEIASQLQEFSKDGALLSAEAAQAVYKNIQLKKELPTHSDSIQKFVFHLDIVSKENSSRDSITAILTKQRIALDGEEFFNTKVTFEKN